MMATFSPRLDIEGEILCQMLAADIEIQPVHRQHKTRTLIDCVGANVDVFRFCDVSKARLAHELFLTPARLLGIDTGAVAADVFELLGDVLLLLEKMLVLHGTLALLFFLIFEETHRISCQALILQIHHRIDDGVEKIFVVGNDEHGALEIFQKYLQPFDGRQVEMVCRLVQQQDVRIPRPAGAPASHACARRR